MDFQVKSIYDPGTAKFLEDKIVIYPPFFGVLDGVSGLYDSKIGPRLFEGKTGGQKVVEIIDGIFADATSGDKLIDLIRRANDEIRKFSESEGLSMLRSDDLPGTTFAFAKITDDNLEIVQGGDCFAVWKKKNGELGATPNRNFSDEEEKIGILNSLIEKCGGDRAKGWSEYMPISAKMRIDRINKGLENSPVVFNGQPEGEAGWQRFILPLKDIKTLLLFTDGMIEFSEGRDADEMGRTVMGAYNKSGLEGMLSRIRDIENNRTYATHIAKAEATAVAIEF